MNAVDRKKYQIRYYIRLRLWSWKIKIFQNCFTIKLFAEGYMDAELNYEQNGI